MDIEELKDKYGDWYSREDDLLVQHLLEEFMEDLEKLNVSR